MLMLPVSRVIPQSPKVTFSATDRPNRQLINDKFAAIHDWYHDAPQWHMVQNMCLRARTRCGWLPSSLLDEQAISLQVA